MSSALGQSRHFGPVRRMSACPLTAAREQTFRDRSFGPSTDSCTAANRSLFDYLVDPRQERFRNCQPEALGGLEVDHKLELGGLLDWNFGGLYPTQQFGQLPSKNVSKNRL